MRAMPLTLTATATALTAALLLTACDSGSGTGTGTDAKNTANTDANAAGTGSGTGTGTACALGNVTAQVGPVSAAPAAGDTGTVTVTLTNNGTDCTLDGFPKVALEAAGTKAEVPADPAAQAQKMTLAKGGTTSFTITYTRAAATGAQSLAAKTATYALPATDNKQSFPWSYGEVALKGTTPDATVSGFEQSGD